MKTINEDITFHNHELPLMEVRMKYEALMIIDRYNKIRIKRTLVYNSSALNVCSVGHLEKLDVEK
jgi:hypothetical protein